MAEEYKPPLVPSSPPLQLEKIDQDIATDLSYDRVIEQVRGRRAIVRFYHRDVILVE